MMQKSAFVLKWDSPAMCVFINRHWNNIFRGKDGLHQVLTLKSKYIAFKFVA